MKNLVIMNLFKKIVIISLILAMGLGFFVGQTPEAEAGTVAHREIGQFGTPVTSITVDGQRVYFASGRIGSSLNGQYISKIMDLDLELRENSGPYTWMTATQIRSIVISNDGQTIYFSGLFTHVNGQERNGMAAIDSSGSLLDWNPQINRRAYVNLAMDSAGNYIYAYGDFKEFGDSGSLSAIGHCVYKIRVGDGYVTSWRMDGFEGELSNDQWIENIFFDRNGNLYSVIRFPYKSNWSTNEFAIYQIDQNSGSRSIVFYGPDRLVDDDLGYYLFRWEGSIYDQTSNKLILALMDENIYSFAGINLANNQFSFVTPQSYDTDLRKMAVASGRLYLVIKEKGTNVESIKVINISNGNLEKYGDLPDFVTVDSINVSENGENIYVAGTLMENYDESTYGKWRPGDVITIKFTDLQSTDLVESGSMITDSDYLTGELVKEAGKPAVYLLRQGYKHPILNGDVFEAYGWRWEDVQEYESLAVHRLGPAIGYPVSATLREGSLIKRDGDAKVYVLSNNKKRWISSEKIFNELGYRFTDIIEVTAEKLNSYATGAEVNTLYHPDGALIKYPSDPRVWRIEGGKKRLFLNEASFTGGGYKWEMILNIMPTLTYPDGPAM